MLNVLTYPLALLVLMLTQSFVAMAANEQAKGVADPPTASKAVVDPYSEDMIDPDSVDARKRILQAPKFEINKVRDPFVSYLDKMNARERQLQAMIRQRQEEARRRIDSRVKEPLESFDLSALKFVATFSMGDREIAVIEDAEGVTYQVKVGNYMGRNNGRIEKIEPDRLILIEKRIDPAGDIMDSQQVIHIEAPKGA